MDPVLDLDFETRSELDLSEVGVHKYARHPSTSISCGAFKFSNEAEKDWWCEPLGRRVPERVVRHVMSGGKVRAHNAIFERTLWNAKIAKGRPEFMLKIPQMDCTLARAAALALPQKLEDLVIALGLKVRKDMEGNALMKKMCKPRGYKDGQPIWLEDEASHRRQVEYCLGDVDAEIAADHALPPLSARERAIWEMDQRINDRGIPIDVELVRRAMAVAEIESALAAKELAEITEGFITSPNQHQRVAQWLKAKGLDCPNGVGKDVIGDVIEQAEAMGFQDVLDMLTVRADAAKSSLAKFRSMLASEVDGRIYGSFAYHAASTGRWAGRLVQPHNLPRIDDEKDEIIVADVVEILLQHDAETAHMLIMLQYGKPLKWLSLAIRSMIKAPPGRKFIGADFSNIEGRYNAWSAGEDWKIEAFKAFDRGEGPDLYKVTSGRILGKEPADVTKQERQESGKVPELSLGFQGGYRALQKMAKKYKVKMTNQRAEEIKVGWRMEHPQITMGWAARQEAALAAVKAPGIRVDCAFGRVSYLVTGGFLLCRLPSNRVLAYARPEARWSRKTMTNADGDEYEINSEQVFFWGIDSKTKKWSKQALYGGLQCENDTQGGARDALVDAMFRMEGIDGPWQPLTGDALVRRWREYAERFNAEIVLHVHDEVMMEVDDDFDELQLFADVMAKPVPWAPGLPIAVAPWEGDRY